jgi:hypothetical protein
MSEPTNLSNVPMKFLNSEKWPSLRKFASKDIIALCYINAPYPDEEDPRSFFWDRRGSPAPCRQRTMPTDRDCLGPDTASGSPSWQIQAQSSQAIRCYKTGRSLLEECRSLLNEGKLVASGVEKATGKRKIILAREWVNLWPMFATGRAV